MHFTEIVKKDCNPRFVLKNVVSNLLYKLLRLCDFSCIYTRHQRTNMPLSAQRVPFGVHWERAPSDLYKLLLLRDFSCTHHSQRPNAPLSCPVTMPSLIGGPGHHWNTLEWPLTKIPSTNIDMDTNGTK